MPRSADELISEASALPLRDAAYAIWRQRIAFQRLEGRARSSPDLGTPPLIDESLAAIRRRLEYEHDFAQDGPTFERLKRAHPNATDGELKEAIIAAVKFDDDCFRYFKYARLEDFWDMCVHAVDRAARENPPLLETTYRDARNYVAYCMK